MTTLFTATLAQPYSHPSPFTKGKVYDVIDFNDYMGTYTIINDDGEQACVDWMRFADQGKASSAYQRSRRQVTDYSTPVLHAVHLYRWDDTFGGWDHEASFRLYTRAAKAAEALTLGSSHTFKVVDAREGEASTFYYRSGQRLPDALVPAAMLEEA